MFVENGLTADENSQSVVETAAMQPQHSDVDGEGECETSEEMQPDQDKDIIVNDDFDEIFNEDT